MGRGFCVVAACALLASLLGAANSEAKTVLLVGGPKASAASGATTIEVRGAGAGDAGPGLTTYVPNGYTTTLGYPAGTRIGSVDAHAQLLETRSSSRVTGTI